MDLPGRRESPECAGVIHTDFQRGFIKAECIRWDELLGYGSWAKAKEAGKVRIEERTTRSSTGTSSKFRFNV